MATKISFRNKKQANKLGILLAQITQRALMMTVTWKLYNDDSGYSSLCQAYQTKPAITVFTPQMYFRY